MKEFTRQDICPNCKWEGEFRRIAMPSFMQSRWIKRKECRNCGSVIRHDAGRKYYTVYTPLSKRGNELRNISKLHWGGKHPTW